MRLLIARLLVLLSLLFAALSGAPTGAAGAGDVDLEIVLAVDASGSVNAEEFKLQLGGVAAAFRDPAVQQAILSGPRGRIAVALLVWSDSAFPKFATAWHVVGSMRAAKEFADIAENFHHKAGRNRGIGGGGTAIGDAVAHAIAMLENNAFTAIRRVIDVSGDGIETPPWFGTAVTMPEARVLAAAAGVTVNGLAIINDFPRLDEWYQRNVISGPGSFVIVANDFHDFRRAIRKKLWREFSSPIAARSFDRVNYIRRERRRPIITTR